MSSIRPLATITLLAVAGLILYVKITETEPVIPADVGEYEFNVGLDSGVDAPEAWTAGGFDDAGASAPAFAATAGGEAPTFDAAAAPEAGDAAPAWNADTASPAVTAEAPAYEAAAVVPPIDANAAAQAATASEPPMPQLPGDETAAAQDVAVPAAVGAAAVSAYAAAPDFSSAGSAPAVPTESGVPAIDSVASEPVDSAPADTPQDEAAAPGGRYSTYDGAPAQSPTNSTADVLPTQDAGEPTESLYAKSKVAIQSALDRGELSQALQMLSDWRGDPSLTAQEEQEVETLLGQLAGSVIYSTEHRLEAPYLVQPGETLEQVAAKYQVSAQLLGKINGIAPGTPLAAGKELKVVRGPFSATIDVSERELTLMLDRRYAGRFRVEVDPTLTVEDGQWQVVDKPVAPASVTAYQATPGDGVDRTVMLQNPGAASGQVAVLRGPGTPDPVSAPEPAGRVIRLSSRDIEDVFDILSVGSQVTIQR